MPAITPQNPTTEGEGAHLLLYDGVCGLCDRLIRFILARDARGVFRFAALQGAVARSALHPFGVSTEELTTFRVLVNYDSATPEQLTKGHAMLFVLSQLGWPWRAAVLLKIVPVAMLNRLYDLVAQRRYSIGGRFERCLMPRPEHLGRFIDLNEDAQPGP